jgi:hypothetical protein
MAYSDVTGQWIEPKASCSAGATSVAIWVGLGGYSVSSQKLEQAGTSADCRANGRAIYYAWYELVPENAVDLKLQITPGDLITSAVVVDGTSVLVQVTDRTRGTRVTRRLTMDSPDRSSAEWIVEAPSECVSQFACQALPLADFGSVGFDSATATSTTGTTGSITDSRWWRTKIMLMPGAQRFIVARQTSDTAGTATPSTLQDRGSQFGVTYGTEAVPNEQFAGTLQRRLRAAYVEH